MGHDIGMHVRRREGTHCQHETEPGKQSVYYQHDTWVTGEEVRKTESGRVILWDKTRAASGLTLDVENMSEVCGTQS